MSEVVWRPNNDITRMHAVDVVKCGPIVPALCGWAIDERVHFRGDEPDRCKHCERKVDGGD
jgi:hypothetical protein